MVENSDLPSIDVEPVGPPPGFENTHVCADEIIISPSLVNLVTSRAQKDLQHLTSWFDMAKSEVSSNTVSASTPGKDIDDTDMTLALSKSQKQ